MASTDVQPNLFAEPRAFVNGCSVVSRACSRAGARQVQPKAGTQANRILELLRYPVNRHDGYTLHELVELLHLPLATICARVGWLKQQGLVKPSGATRPGPTGVANHVLVAVDSGQAGA